MTKKPKDIESEEWWKTSEVAARFGVDEKTIYKWIKSGKMDDVIIIRTLGGHRRYKSAHIKKKLESHG